MIDVIDEQPSRTRQRDGSAADLRFASARAATITRLVRHGMARAWATAWVYAWDETTRGLFDFRRAPDFWHLGYQNAVEEHRRGYEPPDFLTSGATPSRGLALGDERVDER